MMPGMDGVEVLNAIRFTPGGDKCKVVALTANALSGVREEYLDKGFADYISKPVDIKELLRIVKLHLPGEKIKNKID